MLHALAFVAAGLVGMGLTEALAVAFGLRFALPDVPVLVAVYAARRRSALTMALTSVALGYVAGRHALAPDGQGVCALVAVTWAVFVASGSLSGGGRGFYVLACGAGCVASQGLMWAMACSGAEACPRRQSGAILLQGLMTALAACAAQPLLARLEAALAPRRREDLRWR